MSNCRFLYQNLVQGPDALSLSSARPGAVGLPAPESLGSAMCYASGEHTGAQDQLFWVEIDSEGGEVGAATFRWRRSSAASWEASGVPTSSLLTTLADGVGVKWAPGEGQDLYRGDRWTILAVGRRGEQDLCDRDRDTQWRATGCASEWVRADLGSSQRTRALVLADHNLSDEATATLKARDLLIPDPVWSFDPTGGELTDSLGQSGSNARSTGRTYIDGGVLHYAAAGETCFEDGLLSLQPAATNRLPYSEQLDNALWGTVRTSVTPNAAVAPDGETTADKLVEDATSAASHKLYSHYYSLTAGDKHTASIFAKAGDRSHFVLSLKNSSEVIIGLDEVVFDLSSGTVLSGDDGGIQYIGDGWYRCWVAGEVDATGPARIFAYMHDGATKYYDGDGSSGLYLWGAQLEAGPVPTAYIPTEASAAYRAGDAITFPLPAAVAAAMSSGGEGCLAAEWTPGFDPGDLSDAYRPIVAVNDSIYAALSHRAKGGGRIYTDWRAANIYTDLAWTMGTAYVLAARWSSATGQVQSGHGVTWGPAGAYDGDYTLGSCIYLGYNLDAPFHLGRVAFFDQWLDDAPRALLDPWVYPAHSQALSVTSPHLTRFLDATYRYWRLELADPDNPDGELRASLFYLGDYFEPERTFASGYVQGTVAGRQVTASDAGKVAGNTTSLAGYFQLSFLRVSAEDLTRFEAMMAAIHQAATGSLRPLFFVPFADQPEDLLYCLPSAELERQRQAGGRWSLGLGLEEVVRTNV